MQPESLIKLVSDIRKNKAESQTVEIKSAAKGCPEKLFDTLSAFSNQDSGGIIVFGISESDDYSVTGVYDAQDLQVKVASQCKQMSPEVRALFTICQIDEKTVVSAEIPGVDISERPVFYKGKGRIGGSYVRIGEADELMNEYEIYSYEAFRKKIHDDMRTVRDINVKLVDHNKIALYLTAVKRERPNLAVNVSDEDILELMGVIKEGRLTLAGAMVFYIFPQAYFPQLCITAVSYPGNKIGELGSDGERFTDNKRITGPIPDMLEEAVEFVSRNSRVKTIIDEKGKRIDKEEYPLRAVREVILNALVHRDYSQHTEDTPIRIEMYRDRIEVINPGGMYGRISIDKLGKARPETRNAVLANILEILRITENRYSGIPTIYAEFKAAKLMPPVFSAIRGEFKVVMKNEMQGSLENSDNILNFCSVPRTRDEIAEFVGMSKNYVMSKIVNPLVAKGVLKLTVPDKPRSSKQKYFASEKLL